MAILFPGISRCFISSGKPTKITFAPYGISSPHRTLEWDNIVFGGSSKRYLQGEHYEMWKLFRQHANVSFISDDMRKIE